MIQVEGPIMALCCERGQAETFLFAQRYSPKVFLRRFKQLDEQCIWGEVRVAPSPSAFWDVACTGYCCVDGRELSPRYCSNGATSGFLP